MAVEMHCDDRARTGCSAARHVRGIERPGDRIDVRDDGACSRVDDGVRGGDERQGGDDHLVAGTDASRGQRQVQGGGPA